MAYFGDLPLAIMRSISAVSGDIYQGVEQPELREDLARRGFEPSDRELYGAVEALERDGYVRCGTWLGGMQGPAMMRLDTRGRQEVEDWPTSPGSISSKDVEQLVQDLERLGDDPTLTSDEQGKAKAAAAAVGSLGLTVAGGVIVGWLKSIGLA